MDPENKITSDEEEFDIAKEFNIILDSVADESNFTHDPCRSYFPEVYLH